MVNLIKQKIKEVIMLYELEFLNKLIKFEFKMQNR
jgi:hypothetical protein